MRRYGKVTFLVGGEKGAKLQNTLYSRLNAEGIITVPKETIEKWYEDDKKDSAGCDHTYVLHSKEEVDIFRTVMESDEMKDNSVIWKIYRFNRDKRFQNWIKEHDA